MENKAIRISEYVLNRVRKFGETYDCSGDDQCFRYLLTEYDRLSSPASGNAYDFYNTLSQKNNKRGEAKQEKIRKIYECIALGKKNILLGQSISYAFADFVNLYTILKSYCNCEYMHTRPVCETIPFMEEPLEPRTNDDYDYNFQYYEQADKAWEEQLVQLNPTIDRLITIVNTPNPTDAIKIELFEIAFCVISHWYGGL